MHKIYSSAPINKTAAIVTGAGEHYTPNKKIQTGDSDFPIKSRNPNSSEKASDNFTDLTGVKYGRFTVIGISAEHHGKWVVRCVCGVYTTRKTKAIKNKNNNLDRCEACRHAMFLKREEYFRRTGREIDISLLS